jgi:hypothetical protein
MRCIFCKADSSSSISVEHIIPESLWNTKQILPRGVVCDSCNNYFARKVEKPFMAAPAFTHLRFHEAVPNKKGRIPTMEVLISPGHAVRAHRGKEKGVAMTIDVPPELFEKLRTTESGQVILPISGDLPEGAIVSRFLAKVAVEAMAQRLLGKPELLERFIDESEFDPLRKFARSGQPKEWPHHSRRLYPTTQRWTDESGQSFQVVHEYDFLHTRRGEVYFVLALYGLELTINVGGPDIDLYSEWLSENENASALHTGRNSAWPMPQDARE